MWKENVDAVMLGCEHINFGCRGSSNHFSLLKTSSAGLSFIQNDEVKLKEALKQWSEIIVRQVLHVPIDMDLDATLDTFQRSLPWIASLRRIIEISRS